MGKLTVIFVVTIIASLARCDDDSEVFTCRKQYFEYGKSGDFSRNKTFVLRAGEIDRKIKVQWPLIKMPLKLTGIQITVCDSRRPRVEIYSLDPKVPKNTFVLIRRKGMANGEAFGVMECFFDSAPIVT